MAMRIRSRVLLWTSVAGCSLLLACGCSGGDRKEPAKEEATASTSGEPKTWPAVPPGKGNKPDPAKPDPKGPAPFKPGPAPPMGKVSIPETDTKGWKASGMAPKDLAQKVNGAIAGLTDTLCTARVFMKTPAGQARAGAIHKIQDSQHFRLDYFSPKGLPDNARGFILADGVRKRQITLGSDPKIVPIDKPLPDSGIKPAEVLQRWPQDFSRMMMLSLTDKVDPWSPLIQSLAKGEGGFKTTIEQRSLQYKGRTVNSYRVFAKRSDAMAKKLGACELEMVIDARRFLPVTIRVKSQDKSGRDWDQQWSAAWDFRKKFVKKDFESIQ